MYKRYHVLVQNLGENVDENLTWLTQKTEDPKYNKGNLTFPPHTVNVIKLNCKVLKKVAYHPFLHQPPLSRFILPLYQKNCTPLPQVTQFLEGPTPVPLEGKAEGKALDLLIVFKGKFLQTTWLSLESLKNTYFAASNNGWMTTKIFHDWFTKFVETVETKLLLLLFDGHLTHLSLATIDLVIQENISLVKLPAHCTDILLPTRCQLL